jgi:hypothetical protein
MGESSSQLNGHIAIDREISHQLFISLCKLHNSELKVAYIAICDLCFFSVIGVSFPLSDRTQSKYRVRKVE